MLFYKLYSIYSEIERIKFSKSLRENNNPKKNIEASPLKNKDHTAGIKLADKIKISEDTITSNARSGVKIENDNNKENESKNKNDEKDDKPILTNILSIKNEDTKIFNKGQNNINCEKNKFIEEKKKSFQHEQVKYSKSSTILDKCYIMNEAKLDNLDKIILDKEDLVENFSDLCNLWKFSLFGNFPQKRVKDYFGEKICMYFNFLSLYTKYLFFLSILGIIVYVVQMTDSDESHNIELFYDKGYTKSMSVIVINTIYSFSVIIWSTIFLEKWKRDQAQYATLWGQLDYESREETMPTYKGKIIRSPLNDNINEIYFSPMKTFMRKILAHMISLMIVIIVITIVVYLLYFRNWLVINKVWGDNNKIIQNIPSKIILKYNSI